MESTIKKKCKCGCGEFIEIKPHHKYVGIPEYIYNHHSRGRPLTDIQRKAIIYSNKTRKISEKVKQTLRDISINRRWTEKQKQKISMRMAGDDVFQGYKTTNHQRIRQSITYRDWRTKVFERDNYTCQLTGKKGTLIVHHLNNFANNEKLRFELDNGITLLRTVHYDFHKK